MIISKYLGLLLCQYIHLSSQSDLHRDFYTNATPLVLNVFHESARMESDRIFKKRSEVLNSEPKYFKLHGYEYSIYTYFIKQKLADYTNYLSYIFSQYESITYSNRFDSFLESHLYLLSYNTPKLFLLEFSVFFDNFIYNFLNFRLRQYKDLDLLKKLIYDLSISAEIQSLENISWEDIESKLSTILLKKVEIFKEIEMSNMKSINN